MLHGSVRLRRPCRVDLTICGESCKDPLERVSSQGSLQIPGVERARYALPEPLAVPLHDGGWLDEREGSVPTRPDAVQQDPEEPVTVLEPLNRSLPDCRCSTIS